MMLALLRQLVYVAGIDPADISIGDPVAVFPNQYYQPLHDEFPEVTYLDAWGDFGRTRRYPLGGGLPLERPSGRPRPGQGA